MGFQINTDLLPYRISYQRADCMIYKACIWKPGLSNIAKSSKGCFFKGSKRTFDEIILVGNLQIMNQTILLTSFWRPWLLLVELIFSRVSEINSIFSSKNFWYTMRSIFVRIWRTEKEFSNRCRLYANQNARHQFENETKWIRIVFE